MAERCEKCGQPTEHQGWKNYETWAVTLWIDNEQGTQDAALCLTQNAVDDAPDDENVASGIWTVEQTERFRLADSLKEWADECLIPDLGATLAADLLGAAFEMVDWNEVAAHYLADFERPAKAEVQP